MNKIRFATIVFGEGTELYREEFETEEEAAYAHFIQVHRFQVDPRPLRIYTESVERIFCDVCYQEIEDPEERHTGHLSECTHHNDCLCHIDYHPDCCPECRTEVDLIASGYEWTCPHCTHLNREIEVTEEVVCSECNHAFKVHDYYHAHK